MSTNKISKWLASQVEAGHFQFDPHQTQLAHNLDNYLSTLQAVALSDQTSAWSLTKLFRTKPEQKDIRGLYVYGAAGHGKSVLLNRLFDYAPSKRKRRDHYISFIAGLHDEISSQRKRDPQDTSNENAIARAVQNHGRNLDLIYLDELEIIDIADALIMLRFFSYWLSRGGILLTTSNMSPEGLYENGLNRQLFLPFVELIRKHCMVLEVDAAHDYRLLQEKKNSHYFIDNQSAAASGKSSQAVTTQFRQLWTETTGTSFEQSQSDEVHLLARTIFVPRVANRAAYFAYEDLLVQKLSSRDYLEICTQYRSIFIDGIPILSSAKINIARRLVLFLDIAFDHEIELNLIAHARPEELLQVNVEGRHRCISRLNSLSALEIA